MKRLAQILFIISITSTISLIAYFYFSSLGNRKTDEPVRLRALEAGSNITASQAALTAEANEFSTSSIPLEPNETLLDLYSFNLDFDDEEEQVLIIRQSDDSTGVVWIVLADYSPYNKKWTRSWKGGTLITKVKTFQVSVFDLIGDHNLNIVCSGMNEQNEQTMTIYWKSADKDRDQGTTFVKIFEQAGNAVVVESIERPDSYKLGQSNADSWPVSVWRADSTSGNYLDQLRETWQWSFTERAFILASTERIAGAVIARKMAETILDGTVETFENFLDGTWYKESNDPLSSNALFITFQSRDDSVMFSGEGLIEVYEWENSNPTRYGLYIASRNQSVVNLRRLMDIELASTDSVQVRVFQDYRIKADISGKWDGRYRRLSEEMAMAFKRTQSMATATELDLTGNYEAEDGAKLTCIGNTYALETPQGIENGTYTIFELDGKIVMDMRKTVDQGQIATRRSWILSRTTAKGIDGATIQVMNLQEAKVGIHGIESVQTQAVSWRKIQ